MHNLATCAAASAPRSERCNCQQLAKREALPTSLNAYKTHELYCVEKLLKKHEAPPPTPSVTGNYTTVRDHSPHTHTRSLTRPPPLPPPYSYIRARIRILSTANHVNPLATNAELSRSAAVGMRERPVAVQLWQEHPCHARHRLVQVLHPRPAVIGFVAGHAVFAR